MNDPQRTKTDPTETDDAEVSDSGGDSDPAPTTGAEQAEENRDREPPA